MKNYKCPECGGELEQGSFTDSHGMECPTVTCVDCGDRVFPEDLIEPDSAFDAMVEYELTHA